MKMTGWGSGYHWVLQPGCLWTGSNSRQATSLGHRGNRQSSAGAFTPMDNLLLSISPVSLGCGGEAEQALTQTRGQHEHCRQRSSGHTHSNLKPCCCEAAVLSSALPSCFSTKHKKQLCFPLCDRPTLISRLR